MQRFDPLFVRGQSKSPLMSMPFSRHINTSDLRDFNILYALPVTDDALSRAHELLFDGQSVHFQAYSLTHYEKAMKLYLRAIEDRDIHFRDLKSVMSVISFDVAAIDAAVNERLEHAGGDYSHLRNKAAIALLYLARQKYARYFSGDSWTWLADHGAQLQPILVDMSAASHAQYYADALAGLIQHFAVSMRQIDSDEIRFEPDRTHGMAVENPAHVLRDLGEIGIHLDELGEALIDEARR